MRSIIPILILIILFTSCKKQEVADVLGRWQIEKQVTASYSGLEKTNEQVIEVYKSFMQFDRNGKGALVYPSGETPFGYTVTSDQIILSTGYCKRSSWHIVETSGTSLVIEHSNPTMVIVRYLRRVD